jgi:alpha-glucosidase
MIIRKWLCLFALVSIAHLGFAATTQVTSPDGNLSLHLDVKSVGTAEGCPVYSITYRSRPVLVKSRLGLMLSDGSLSEGFTIAGETRSSEDTTWAPVCGERKAIRDDYHQLIVDLKQTAAPHRLMRLTFRAYDAGIAFCYSLPAQEGLNAFTITREKTQFSFAANHTAWAVYSAQGNYDGSEVMLDRIKPGAERPLTVRVADDLYASITEARLIDYARMKLRPATDPPHALEAFLDAERGKEGQVTGTAPFISPWRVVMVAPSPARLLEQNDIILNLNNPSAIEDTSWIKPGKVIREVTLSTVGGKACVDFCVQRGMQYIELDAGWYGPEGDTKSDARAVSPKRAENLDLHEVIRYAKEHGIGVILYVNHRAMERQLDEILPLYQQWGVSGVKYGFVNVGSQHWTAFLHEAIRKAAACHLMVDIHDEFRSTGYQRTYPNLMTVEGIGGDETFPTPVHNATLPFTRSLTGPADHTYCWYDKRLKVTHAQQLAITTIFFSPWQFLYWYDRPAAFNGDPALEYWKQLPTTWDDTRVIAGEIGKLASVARRKGDDWFVGTIHAGVGGRVDIPLNFLEPGRKYTATIYSDESPDDPASKAVKIETRPVDSKVVVQANIAPNGGHAMRIVPAESR